MIPTPLWFRVCLLVWAAFVVWLGLRYQPPLRYRRTYGQRRVLAIGRPLVVLVGVLVFVFAVWP